MSYFTTKDNTRIYYKDWGSGSTVILIHGWPLSSDSWDDQAIALVNAGHRVIAYDRRGFGRSSQPWHGYDYNTLADDLAALISHTAVNDVALVGFSMGGYLALSYVLTQPLTETSNELATEQPIKQSIKRQTLFPSWQSIA